MFMLATRNLDSILESNTFLGFPGCRSKNIFTYGCRILGCSIMNSFSTFGLYKDLKTILNQLNDPQHNGVKAVQELLTIFNNAKQRLDEQQEEKKHPLIILEGLDGSGKTAMTRQLATKIHAEKWQTPPESIRFLRTFFDNHAILRTAYYSLGNYIAALEVGCVLTHKPVVMDRFWHSTTAYALAQKVFDSANKLTLPHAEDDIYNWPSDLLKPDIVLLLQVSEEIRLQRHSRRSAAAVTCQEKLLKDDIKFREGVLQAYTNMRNPGLVLVDGDGSLERTVNYLMEKIKPLCT